MTENQRAMARDFTESLRYLKRNFFEDCEAAYPAEPEPEPDLESEPEPEKELAGMKRPKVFGVFVPATELQARGSEK